MFLILGLLFIGICAGVLLRHVKVLKKLEQSISLTIGVMLFVFGITIGANRSLLENIGHIGIQAVVLAVAGVSGSVLAAYIAGRIFDRKGGSDER